MPNGNRPTVDEHYIPQVYLKGFSSNNKTIFRFDLKKENQSSKEVPISSIAFKKNGYEMQDGNNAFINRNFIEKSLSMIEAQFPKYREMLERKAFLKENWDTISFLSKEEKDYWKLFVTLQLMRDPVFIKAGQESAHTYYKNTISLQAAKNRTLIGCFPFFQSSINNPTGTLFEKVFDILYEMNVMVKAARGSNLIISDNPVCITAKSGSFEGITGAWMPITPDMAILFFKKGLVEGEKRNSLSLLKPDAAEKMNKEIIRRARNELYSKDPFNKTEITLIKEIRKTKTTKLT